MSRSLSVNGPLNRLLRLWLRKLFLEIELCFMCRMLDGSGEVTNETKNVTSFVSDSPSLGLWCRFKRSAEKIIWNTLFWIMSMAVGNVYLK